MTSIAGLSRTLSPSKAAAFTSCPRAFSYRYVEHVEVDGGFEHQLRGTTVHGALQRLFALDGPERTEQAALDYLPSAYDAALAEDGYAWARGDGELRDSVLHDSAGLVLRCFQLEDPTEVTAIGLEVQFSEDLDGVVLHGIIDRLDLRREGLVVVDYKTSAAPKTQYERRALTAVSLYAWLVERSLGQAPVAAELFYLGDRTRLRIDLRPSVPRGAISRALAIWQAIERCEERGEWRAMPGPLCAFCAYTCCEHHPSHEGETDG